MHLLNKIIYDNIVLNKKIGYISPTISFNFIKEFIIAAAIAASVIVPSALPIAAVGAVSTTVAVDYTLLAVEIYIDIWMFFFVLSVVADSLNEDKKPSAILITLLALPGIPIGIGILTILICVFILYSAGIAITAPFVHSLRLLWTLYSEKKMISGYYENLLVDNTLVEDKDNMKNIVRDYFGYITNNKERIYLSVKYYEEEKQKTYETSEATKKKSYDNYRAYVKQRLKLLTSISRFRKFKNFFRGINSQKRLQNRLTKLKENKINSKNIFLYYALINVEYTKILLSEVKRINQNTLKEKIIEQLTTIICNDNDNCKKETTQNLNTLYNNVKVIPSKKSYFTVFSRTVNSGKRYRKKLRKHTRRT